MFKRLRNNKKSFYKELVVPEGCRELTDEEMFRINGGSTEKNGISNPDVIHPGQHINFGDSSSGVGNPATSPSASQANGNYGANGSYGSACASPSNASSGVS